MESEEPKVKRRKRLDPHMKLDDKALMEKYPQYTLDNLDLMTLLSAPTKNRLLTLYNIPSEKQSEINEELRKIKNRRASKQLREKKQQQLKALESQVKANEAETSRLTDKIKKLEEENKDLQLSISQQMELLKGFSKPISSSLESSSGTTSSDLSDVDIPKGAAEVVFGVFEPNFFKLSPKIEKLLIDCTFTTPTAGK